TNDNHRHLSATTTGLPTSFLAGGSSSGARPYLQFHLGKPEGDSDCSKPSSPSKGYRGSIEQSPSGLWSSPMADDGEQRQCITNHQPPVTQQLNASNFPIPTVFPRSSNGGPNGEPILCNDRPPTPPNAIIFCTTREEHLPAPQQHQKGNLQGLRNPKKEKHVIGGGSNLRPPTNIFAPTGLSQGNRVQ
ncbi:hypothetical protein A4A49_65950, partial [Nicotiana attenuata]